MEPTRQTGNEGVPSTIEDTGGNFGPLPEGVDRPWTLDDVPALEALGFAIHKAMDGKVTIIDVDEAGELGIEFETLKLLDVALERACRPHPWGLCKFHPLSFGAGFLLSSLFWLIIGIAIGVLS